MLLNPWQHCPGGQSTRATMTPCFHVRTAAPPVGQRWNRAFVLKNWYHPLHPARVPSSDGTLMEQAADTVSVGEFGAGVGVRQCSGSCLCLSQLNYRGSLFPQEAITCQASLMFLLLLERSTCSPLVILKSRKWEEVQCVHRFFPLYIYFRLPVEVRRLCASKSKLFFCYV